MKVKEKRYAPKAHYSLGPGSSAEHYQSLRLWPTKLSFPRDSGSTTAISCCAQAHRIQVLPSSTLSPISFATNHLQEMTHQWCGEAMASNFKRNDLHLPASFYNLHPQTIHIGWVSSAWPHRYSPFMVPSALRGLSFFPLCPTSHQGASQMPQCLLAMLCPPWRLNNFTKSLILANCFW